MSWRVVSCVLGGAVTLGSAIGLGCRGDWWLAAVLAAVVVVPVALRVRRELLATRDEMCRMPATGRHRRQHRPRELQQAPVVAD